MVIFFLPRNYADFSDKEVVKRIASLKGSKAAGVDKVLNEYFKSIASIFLSVYVNCLI